MTLISSANNARRPRRRGHAYVAAAFQALMRLAVEATVHHPGRSLLPVQRDIVTGAANLLAVAEEDAPALVPMVREYHDTARAALKRLERQQGGKTE